MNYRHAFHAGGFADVIKHIVLVRILLYLHEKPAAFRVLDTHAGAGRYDLTGEEARRGGEWLTGIARIMQARFSEKTLSLLKPYLDVVRAFNPQGALTAYPGSPLIARALLRPQDRLTACEVEPDARKHLIDGLRRDTQARVVDRSEEHTSELQSQSNLVCRLLLEKKKKSISEKRFSRDLINELHTRMLTFMVSK